MPQLCMTHLVSIFYCSHPHSCIFHRETQEYICTSSTLYIMDPVFCRILLSWYLWFSYPFLSFPSGSMISGCKTPRWSSTFIATFVRINSAIFVITSGDNFPFSGLSSLVIFCMIMFRIFDSIDHIISLIIFSIPSSGLTDLIGFPSSHINMAVLLSKK